MINWIKSARLFLSVTLILILLIAISGCGSSSSSGGLVSYNFKQGVAGLTVKPVPNAPPDRIYPKSAFSLILNLENGAAYDLNNLELSLVGLNGKYFSFDKLIEHIGQFKGKSLDNPIGDQQYVEFKGYANQLFENSEQYAGNYFVKVDYDSNFDFTDSVCVNPALYEVYNSGCKTENQKSYSGQGAPVGITQIEEVIYPYQDGKADIEFRMQIGNRGNGKLSQITFISAKLGNEVVNCDFNGQVDTKVFNFTANKQETNLICKTKVESGASYTTTLYATFKYKYSLEQRYTLNLVK